MALKLEAKTARAEMRVPKIHITHEPETLEAPNLRCTPTPLKKTLEKILGSGAEYVVANRLHGVAQDTEADTAPDRASGNALKATILS